MSLKSKIEWTGSSWNPITGCTKVSAGCQNCYAATFANRLKAMGNPRYTNAFELTIHEDLIDKPLKWTKPQMIFVNSMSDLFHENVSESVIVRLFDTMNKAHWHTFQILTKRAERLVELAPKLHWGDNIWMGVSIENCATQYRCDLLRLIPAQTKFISAEPLLEALPTLTLEGIDWLIVGGESGPRCRPIKEEWVIDLRNKAKASNTAFFFKQWGGTNKKKNGCLLGGKEYKDYPH